MHHKVTVGDIVHTLLSLKESKGAAAGQIVGYLKDRLVIPDYQKRDLTTQVRLALKKGIADRLLYHCAGRYKLMVGSKKLLMKTGSIIDHDTWSDSKPTVASKSEICSNISKSCEGDITTVSQIGHNLNKGYSSTMLNRQGSNYSTFSKERGKGNQRWIIDCKTGNECEAFKPIDSHGLEYLFPSNINNPFNINDTSAFHMSTTKANCSSSIQPMSHESPQYVTNVTPLFYMPSNVPNGYMPSNVPNGYLIRGNCNSTLTDYVKQHLYETSDGIKKAGDMFEISCEQFTRFSPFPMRTNQNILSLPSCTYQIASHNSQRPENVVYLPSSDFIPDTPSDQNIVSEQEPKYDARNQLLSRSLWTLGDDRPSYSAHEDNGESRLRPRHKHCRMCCALESQRNQNECTKCCRRNFSKCICKNAVTSHKSNAIKKDVKKTQGKSKCVPNKKLKGKGQQKNNSTQYRKRNMDMKKASKIQSRVRRGAQRIKRASKSVPDKGFKLNRKLSYMVNSHKKTRDLPVLNSIKNSGNKTVIPVVGEIDIIKEILSTAKSKSDQSQ